MWQEDKASRSFGMTLDSVGPGVAVLSMAIRADMVNGHGTCHGGFIFMLADSAFGFACSSRDSGRSRRTARSPIWRRRAWACA